MKASDITLSVLIILLFIGIMVLNVLTIGISKIKKDWVNYRCNPIVMPFASYFGHEPVSNFTYCIQNMQSSYMEYLMEPTHYIMNLFGNMLSGLSTDIQWIRKKIFSLVSNIQNIVSSILGVFVNILIQFQKIMMKLKDMIGKILGVMATLVYLLDTGVQTGTSVMAGPVGKTLRFVCFHPDTPIKLSSGIIKEMKYINLGDILENGSEVMSTMKIKGNNHNDSHSRDNPYYRIYDNILNTYIYVTGSHLIYDVTSCEFIQVKYYPYAEIERNIQTSEFSCMITTDHKIPIGSHIFWDWED